MEKLGNWLASSWYPIVMSLGGLFFLGLLFGFQLNSLIPGFSEAEIAHSNSAFSLQAIQDNPLNFPHKLLQKGTEKAGVSLLTAGRAASVIIGLGVIGGFFFVLHEWYTRRVAILGTVLFVCSAWFLHAARMGTDSIMYAVLILLVACVAWLQQRQSGKAAIIATAFLATGLLYVPGMIWFVIPLVIWQFGRISRFLQKQNVLLLIALIVVGIGLLTPLAWTFYSSPELIKTYLGLPQAWPSPLEVLKNIASVPIELFFRGPNTPSEWLGRLPLIDWFGSAMFVVGVYAYYFKRQLDRTRFILYAFVVGTILVGLGGPVTMSVLLPFVYLIITGGIALLLQQWFTVFPRNPLARTTGAVLMTLAVLLSAFYNINHYFIAWPHAPETKQVFIQPTNNSLLQ